MKLLTYLNRFWLNNRADNLTNWDYVIVYVNYLEWMEDRLDLADFCGFDKCFLEMKYS
jgi:hypothetical protein